MSNINLNLYKVFCKVAQSKSYSEASEKLGVSVAHISKQIATLEEQLNLKLFNRENKGVTLTNDGEELYNIVNKSISTFDFAEKMAKDKNDMENGCIKIGCPSHFTSYLLMGKLEKVKKDFPKLNVKIICEVDTNKMLELLQNHKVDFAITDAEIISGNVEVQELLTISNIFVSKAPLKISNIKELEDLNCILNLENTKTTQQLMEILEKNNVSLHADMMCDATEIRVEAVKRNMGIAYVIKEAVKNELAKKELYEVELPIELPSIKLKLVYLTGELSKIDKKFIKEYLKK